MQMEWMEQMHCTSSLFISKQREKNKLKEGTKKDHRPKLSICQKEWAKQV
jgi:hypothetical protein